MQTASQAVTRALIKITVQAAEQPVQPDMMATGIDEMNDMMLELDASGIALGYTIVTTPSQVLSIPDGAMSGLINNLAVRLAGEYGGEITQGLYESAKSGMKAMQKIGVVILPTEMPCTLPVGSGNEWSTSNLDTKFYPCPPEEVLTQTGGAILTESGTV